MWQAATQHPACYGARYSGGGEGGVVVALVDAGAVDDFIARSGACYEGITRQPGDFFPVEPVGGAGVFL
jgi:galactokinase